MSQYVFCIFFLHILPNCDDDRMKTFGGFRKKCAKYANFDHLVDHCDLDLVRKIKVILPGRSNILCQYILKFSRRSDNGKGAKRV